MNFDIIDLTILEELQADAKISMASLSTRTGLGEKACRVRVQILEQAGVIDGYVAKVNPRSFGGYLNVFIRVAIDNVPARTRKGLEDLIVDLPVTQSCYLLADGANYLLHVVVKDTDALRTLFDTILTAAPSARIDKADIAIQTIKEENLIPIRNFLAPE
jgi:Lrp/AsnC family transcriptional regulator, leucine-responsive regulatory protein